MTAYHHELASCVRKQLPPPMAGAVFESITWEHNSAVRYFISYRLFFFFVFFLNLDQRQGNMRTGSVFLGTGHQKQFAEALKNL